ncbi:hypothetical protein F4604DRAFT_1928760 [Suillus subluteus]|nr:hypothetical protein F4604DRAFT_1928760 [Suillus subluteus]
MSFPGAAAYFTESEGVSLEAVEDDHTEEIESLEASFEVDDQQSTGQLRSASRHGLQPQKALEHVIVSSTLSNYERLWQQFKQFCMDISKVKTIDEAEHLPSNIPAKYPKCIALWIMDKCNRRDALKPSLTAFCFILRCDENDIWTGKPKLLTMPHATYNNAQKMRAAISHKFGRDYGLRTQPWMENPVYPGKFVHSGETVTSARAMDEPTLKELWVFNCAAERNEHVRISRKRKAEHPEDWGGFLIRMMLYLLYLVSFLCLLRFDKALRITWHNVSFQVKDPLLKGHWIDTTPKIFNQGIFKGSDFHVRLMLPFRKTHQHGGIAPFYLYADIHKP